MNYWIYDLSYTPLIIRLYHVDIDTFMIRQTVGVDIRRGCLERNHLLVDQILNLVLKVDVVLGIMSDTIGVIHTPLIGPVEFGTTIHRLGPH